MTEQLIDLVARPVSQVPSKGSGQDDAATQSPPIRNRVHRWTLDLYLRAIADGYFAPDLRAELLDGVIFEHMPIGSPHAFATTVLGELLREALPRAEYTVRTQNPFILNQASRPEPDAFVARGPNRKYVNSDPRAADLLLVAEVSHSTLDYDLRTKLPLYGAASVVEYWVVDIPNRRLLVHTAPDGIGAYAKTETYCGGRVLIHERFGTIDPADLFVD